MVLGLVALLHPARTRAAGRVAVALLGATAVVLCVYAATLLETRYLWLVGVPLMAASAVFLRGRERAPRAVAAACGIFGALAVASVAVQVPASGQQEVMMSGVREISLASRTVIPPGSPVAGPQGSTFAYCYFAGMRCMANHALVGAAADAKPIAAMRARGVRYYVSISGEAPPLTNLPVVFSASASRECCFDVAWGTMRDCTLPTLVIYDLGG